MPAVKFKFTRRDWNQRYFLVVYSMGNVAVSTQHLPGSPPSNGSAMIVNFQSKVNQ